MNRRAPIDACKGSQGRVSFGSNIGMRAIAPTGAKNLPSHSNSVNNTIKIKKATSVSDNPR